MFGVGQQRSPTFFLQQRPFEGGRSNNHKYRLTAYRLTLPPNSADNSLQQPLQTPAGCRPCQSQYHRPVPGRQRTRPVRQSVRTHAVQGALPELLTQCAVALARLVVVCILAPLELAQAAFAVVGGLLRILLTPVFFAIRMLRDALQYAIQAAEEKLATPATPPTHQQQRRQVQSVANAQQGKRQQPRHARRADQVDVRQSSRAAHSSEGTTAALHTASSLLPAAGHTHQFVSVAVSNTDQVAITLTLSKTSFAKGASTAMTGFLVGMVVLKAFGSVKDRIQRRRARLEVEAAETRQRIEARLAFMQSDLLEDDDEERIAARRRYSEVLEAQTEARRRRQVDVDARRVQLQNQPRGPVPLPGAVRPEAARRPATPSSSIQPPQQDVSALAMSVLLKDYEYAKEVRAELGTKLGIGDAQAGDEDPVAGSGGSLNGSNGAVAATGPGSAVQDARSTNGTTSATAGAASPAQQPTEAMPSNQQGTPAEDADNSNAFVPALRESAAVSSGAASLVDMDEGSDQWPEDRTDQWSDGGPEGEPVHMERPEGMASAGVAGTDEQIATPPERPAWISVLGPKINDPEVLDPDEVTGNSSSSRSYNWR